MSDKVVHSSHPTEGSIIDAAPRARLWPGLAGLVAVTALVLPALSALAQPALPRGGDLLLHFYRLVALDALIQRGLFYVRWMPSLVYGYGYPLFHFYAPLSTYLSEALHLAGASFALSVAALAGLTLWGLGLGTHLWLKDLLASPRAALVGALAAVYAPFVLSTPLARGSLSDALALALLPFAFWALTRLAKKPGLPRLALASLLLAAMLLSHNVTALVSYPILGLYALLVGAGDWGLGIIGRATSLGESVVVTGFSRPIPSWREGLEPLRRAPSGSAWTARARHYKGRPGHRSGTGERRARRCVLLYLAGALLLGLALAAFFWLPALLDQGWTRLDLFVASPEYDYRNNFLSLTELFRPPAPAQEGLMNPAGPYHINPLVLLLGVVGVARSWRARSRARWALALLGLAGLGLLFLTLPQSAGLWAQIPLLPIIQFPFRLLGPASILLAAPAAAAMAGENRDQRREERITLASSALSMVKSAALLVVALLLVVPSTPLLYPLRLRETLDATPAGVTRYQQEAGALGTTSAGEYLPKTIANLPAGPAFPGMDQGAPLSAKLDGSLLPVGSRVEALAGGALTAEWRISAGEPGTATVRTFYFPGWQARLDGRPLPIAPAPETGLITFALPAGEHRVALGFAGTPVTRLAGGLSLAALAALLILLVVHAFRPSLRALSPHPRLSLRALFAKQSPSPDSGIASSADLLAMTGADTPRLRHHSLLFSALGLALLLAKLAYVDRVDNPWRRSFDGRNVPGATQPLNVDLGGQVRALAVEPLPAELVPGEEASLVLYWEALRPLLRDYSSSVQILDRNLNKIAQIDHYRPGGYPATWWLSGEYNRDIFQIKIDPSAAPGVYQVLVVLYDAVTGRRLLPPAGAAGADKGGLLVQRIEVKGGT